MGQNVTTTKNGTPAVKLEEGLQKVETVIIKEAEEIWKQRGLRGHKIDKQAKAEIELPDAVGMAFSGGGIRSATFCLGVLQALARLKLPEKGKTAAIRKPLTEWIDYLSTVSGGGYIGSWYAANRQREQQGVKFLAESDEQSDRTTPAVAHLRRYSHYLNPDAGLMSADTWTMAAVWLRNTLLIQAMVFCVAAVLLMLTRLWMLLMLSLPDLLAAAAQRLESMHCMPKDCFRMAEMLFPACIMACFIYAARKTHQELSLFISDEKKEKEPSTQVRQPMTQDRVQIKIIVPLALAAMTSALWLWCHHQRVEQCCVERLVGFQVLSGKWWKDWWNGSEPETIFSSPMFWGLSMMVSAMAVNLFRLNYTEKKVAWVVAWLRFFVAIWISSMATMYVMDELFMMIISKRLTFGEAKGIDISVGLAAVLGSGLMVAKYLLILFLGLGLAGRRMQDKIREWWSRVGAWLMIYSVAALAGCGIAILGPLGIDALGQVWDGWVQKGVVGGWLLTLVSSVLLGKSDKHTGNEKGGFMSLERLAIVATTGLVIGAAWVVRFMLTPEDFTPWPSDPLLVTACGLSMQRLWVALGLMVFCAAVLIWRIDLNEFSMNHFYRNRLVRCYLGGAELADLRRPHPFTGFDFRDDRSLSALRADGPKPYPGPYLLINTALNTSQGGDLDVQERKAESFLLSPLYCGSQRQRRSLSTAEKARAQEGYRPTALYMSGDKAAGADEDVDSQGVDSQGPKRGRDQGCGIKLGTAVSISGAAASPNSGYHTSPLMAFLMTLFNARLGWWVPNPTKEGREKIWMSTAPKFPGFLQYLSFELFGSATPSSAFVYLSDGGHFENLGVYELVRRRCRFIIAIDAEEDGNYTFHALGTAIRRCRVDFDAEIDINVDELRPDPKSGFSKNHCAVGIIRYEDGQKGTLLYIKSSLTGDESTDIAQYRAMEPSFPHQSTGDQFFNESQFESYRKLGMHVAAEVLNPMLRKLKNPATKPDDEASTPALKLAKLLEEQWYRPAKDPVEPFVLHTQELMVLWKEITMPDMPQYLSDLILPNCMEFVSKASTASAHPQKVEVKMPTTDEEWRTVYSYCQRMIQLMENVFLALKLSVYDDKPDNTGWLNLFRLWAASPVLQHAWTQSKMTYGERFANFWDELVESIAPKENDAKAGEPSPPVK